MVEDHTFALLNSLTVFNSLARVAMVSINIINYSCPIKLHLQVIFRVQAFVHSLCHLLLPRPTIGDPEQVRNEDKETCLTTSWPIFYI